MDKNLCFEIVLTQGFLPFVDLCRCALVSVEWRKWAYSYTNVVDGVLDLTGTVYCF